MIPDFPQPDNYKPTSTCPPLKSLGTLQYTVDTVAPFAIYGFNPETPIANGDANWYQPHDLNGNAWPDAATAEAFAVAHINEHFPVGGPKPVVPTTPTPEQIAAAQTILNASGYVVTPPAAPAQ